jgi:hypothetical protein
MELLAPNGVDAQGNRVEDFGLPLNLMLAHGLTALVHGDEHSHAGLHAALVLLHERFSSRSGWRTR